MTMPLVPAFGAEAAGSAGTFPRPIESYGDAGMTGLWEILKHRVQTEPLNLWVSLFFLAAIVHTFFASRILRLAHHVEHRHRDREQAAAREAERLGIRAPRPRASVAGKLLHFLGEVEAVFGLWVIPLMILLALRLGGQGVIDYLEHRVQFTEPIFVVVIMAIAATRPVLQTAETLLRRVAGLGGGTPTAWWFSILIVAPLLGSLITEPAAMTIAALLLGRQFYRLKPNPRLAYATLGLLFVNVSVGGTLTHFAAPPVLMVAGRWNWNTPFMIQNFGWQAAVGILIATAVCYALLRRDFIGLAETWESESLKAEVREQAEHPVPVWVVGVHLLAMGWTVLNAHHPVLLVGGFLFFVAFHAATDSYQGALELRSPILVGFFLAGLVIHGGLQQWWIAPALGGLSETPLFVVAAGLTAFNDNAAITYLATLVPGLHAGLQHAVVAGAVAGGGLTVIANAPNPAGQAILARFFPQGISPLGLLLGALGPTLIVSLCFLLLPR